MGASIDADPTRRSGRVFLDPDSGFLASTPACGIKRTHDRGDESSQLLRDRHVGRSLYDSRPLCDRNGLAAVHAVRRNDCAVLASCHFLSLGFGNQRVEIKILITACFSATASQRPFAPLVDRAGVQALAAKHIIRVVECILVDVT